MWVARVSLATNEWWIDNESPVQLSRRATVSARPAADTSGWHICYLYFIVSKFQTLVFFHHLFKNYYNYPAFIYTFLKHNWKNNWYQIIRDIKINRNKFFTVSFHVFFFYHVKIVNEGERERQIQVRVYNVFVYIRMLWLWYQTESVREYIQRWQRCKSNWKKKNKYTAKIQRVLKIL